MIHSLDTILTLIERYDYGGAYDLLTEVNLEEHDVGILIDSCRYAINFDFKTARMKLRELTGPLKEEAVIKKLEKNLEALQRGEPEVMFSELIENIKFQLVNEEYIDFLGRVYRFKEAIYKYMFVSVNNNERRVKFVNAMMSKRTIMKSLRKHYKVFNHNIIYGIEIYINKYLHDNFKFKQVVSLMSTQRMNELIELRHESIVGHGFVGVSADDIYRIYGNPYNVVDDFVQCLKHLEISVDRFKYAHINEILHDVLKRLNETFTKEIEVKEMIDRS